MSDAPGPMVAPEDEDALRALWPGLFAAKATLVRALPAADIDLAPLLAMTIPGPAGPTWPKRHRNPPDHFRALEPEFGTRPRLTHLMACLIVALRRAPGPGTAWTLFHRIAAEHGEAVAEAMNTRWLTSVCDTFCDMGDPLERMTGLTGTLSANLVKLAETERRMFYPPRPWPPGNRLMQTGKLFDGVISYWVTGGDMVDNMLGRADAVLSDRNPATPFLAEILARLAFHDTFLQRLMQLNDGREIPLASPEQVRAAKRAMRDL